MTATQGGKTLECLHGGMELSIALHATLVEVFVERRRRAKTLPIRCGGEWFCPGCGVRMVAGDQHVRCPRCGEHLDEVLFQLVEVHPHRQLLLVVEEALDAPGRAVVLAPGIAISHATPEALRVELRRPDGSSVTVPARMHLPFGRLPAERAAVVRLERVTKADVPVGTEVWLLR